MTHGLKRGAWLLPILAPVLLAGCVSRADYAALQAQNRQLQAQNRQLRQELAPEPAHVAGLQGAATDTVGSDLLFAPGSYRLSPSGKSRIAGMVRKLAPGQHEELVVSGYTDNAPIGPAFRRQGIVSHQALSQLRADAVMRFMISQGVEPGSVTAHGFGDARPVASNATAQGRAQNRRIEIAVVQSEPARTPIAQAETPNSPLPAASSDGLIWHVGRMPWREGQSFGSGSSR